MGTDRVSPGTTEPLSKVHFSTERADDVSLYGTPKEEVPPQPTSPMARYSAHLGHFGTGFNEFELGLKTVQPRILNQ